MQVSPDSRAVFAALMAARRTSLTWLARPGRPCRSRGRRRVSEQVSDALLDSGELLVVAEVAAVVIADEDTVVVLEDVERGDRLLGPVPRSPVPDQVGPATVYAAIVRTVNTCGLPQPFALVAFVVNVAGVSSVPTTSARVGVP